MESTTIKTKSYVASNAEECLHIFAQQEEEAFEIYQPANATSTWCNSSWDSFLCWPSAPGNSTALQSCPPLHGLFHDQYVSKFCDSNGRWGDTNMRDCFDLSALDERPDVSPSSIGPMLRDAANTDTTTVKSGYSSSGSVDVVEYVGLSLSMLDVLITLALILFTIRRQWRINQVRIGLLVALLVMCILWLAVRIDKNLKESNYSYKGVIFVHPPVCESFLALLEWSKLLVASWLACVCFQGLLEVVRPVCAKRCINLIFYGIFTIVYSAVVIAIWIVLVKFTEEKKKQHICQSQYEGRPLFHVIIWPCFVLIAAATLLAFMHTLRATFKLCARSEQPNSNKRKIIQGLVHLIICLYACAFWFFNYMAAFVQESFGSTSGQSSLLTVVATYVVYFLGGFIAVWLGASQCCLPAKEI